MLADPNPVFELKAVSFHYPAREDEPALSRIDVTVGQGQCVCILGANGSGKSTLLRILDALYFPSSGVVKAFGRNISRESMEDEDFNFDFRRRVGFVFQDPDVQLFLPTVRDEIAYAPVQLGLPEEEIPDLVRHTAETLGLENLLDRPPYRLSTGEKKKAAIASIVTLDPDVWLMDEPTASLDPRTQSWIIDFIIGLREKGRTLIIATHDLEIPYVSADLCYVMGQDHTILASGSASRILEDHDLLLNANLIHSHRHLHNGRLHGHRHDHWRRSG